MPWRGYFDFIASVDLFVLYDGVQYSSGSWRNRNCVKTKDGLKWITVPVRAPSGAAIRDVVIGTDTRGPWQIRHRRQLADALGQAPHFDEAIALWESVAARRYVKLSELNLDLTRAIADYLAISTPIVTDESYSADDAGTHRLLRLLRRLGASTYVSGPAARNYLDESLFRAEGIRLEYKTYDYPQYPQLWGPFEGAVTVLDLIANCGRQATSYLRSRTPNEVAVP